ncbi:hypothetical protein HYH02_012818 [Chlamydomonas schloesseri]|uniref:Glycosyltransferase subfamily 4-like N-terminal domain-containing protein n=1 Tax=Chlamydomonas schloesseri TaxID=2026947 RepID=A0A835T7R0_9CHLO|nr:hypothetical protein HYH02_012818 [Chlamydomonas schloesseri]|eukprot:KAG2433116.1 hypothetical protein HYH02_012818 [Chlamydomonas schloesseri]
MQLQRAKYSPSYERPHKMHQRRSAVVCRTLAKGRPKPQVALFVEPSPFSHISGMKNRFQCLIRNLREAGDEVRVFTPDPHAPAEYHGAKVVSVLGFKLPFYSSPTLLLSLGLSVNVLWQLLTRRPDVIHVSAPGLMVFAAALYAKLLAVPLVVSYHTHVPEYIPKYTWRGLVEPMWGIIRWFTRTADLALVTSHAMKTELSRNACRSQSIEVWPRGVDADVFHPRHRSAAMRARLSGGVPDAPLLLYVGRLGAEKNLEALRSVLGAVPGCRLALVGDGPARQQLEQHFAGLPVTFMGMLRGEELSAAYASADVFVMPSETETLGFVVLEAMASGLPVVAVAAGGLKDILAPASAAAASSTSTSSSGSAGQQHTTEHASAAAAAATASCSGCSRSAPSSAITGCSAGGGTAAPFGYLYPPGDYAAAARLVAALAASAELRASVGAAARAEVERYGWGEATRVLREQQYRRAIHVHASRRRFAWLAKRVGVTRLLRQLWAALLAAVTALVDGLDYAHDLRRQYQQQQQGQQLVAA